jgi:hypothetical protein
MAPILKRKFVVWWHINEQLTADYRSLFEYPELELADQGMIEQFLRTEWTAKVYNCNDESINIQRDDPHNIIIIKCWRFARIVGEHWPDALTAEDKILWSFRPVTGIMNKVEAILSKSIKPLVGVHIRTCDIYGYHMVKSQKLHPEHKDHFTHSETLVEDLSGFVKAGYDIFVCSDDPNQEKAVIDAYPGSVIRQEKSDDWRTNVNGMHEALVDLYTLARTKLIVGTGGSQFSELASRLGKKPLYTSRGHGTLAPVFS